MREAWRKSIAPVHYLLVLLKERDEKAAGCFGLFLLDPVASAFDEMEAFHVCAGFGAHGLGGTGCLIDAPVAFA